MLAFLFRTFEAEAFVIPTGSMAPTLMGQHKDLECQECGYRHAAGASEGQIAHGNDVVGTVCPMCRHINHFPPDDPAYPNNSGDRILVSKFIYDLQDPHRWDVVVFKFPNNAKQNYIKRLVGLPGETIKIRYGDLWTKPLGAAGDDSADKTADEFRIARKPPAKIRAMLQKVHDTNYIPAALADPQLWPQRWDQPGAGADGWQRTNTAVTDDGRELERPTFNVAAGRPGQTQWLRYRHYVPNQTSQWDQLEEGEPAANHSAQLISDFYSYNAALHGNQGNWEEATPDSRHDSPAIFGLHWVGDLALECNVQVKNDAGQLLLDLVEAGRHYRCAIDVKTGQAVLSIVDIDGHPHPFNGIDDLAGMTGDEKLMQVQGQTSVRGPGKYELMLANVDNRLTLWVDGSVVKFDGSTAYVPDADQPDWNDADEGDLAPVGVGSDGAALEVTRLRVLRDIYYIAEKFPFHANVLNDYGEQFISPGLRPDSPQSRAEVLNIRDILANPRRTRASAVSLFNKLFEARQSVQFDLQKHDSDPMLDQFFTLGDNSPESQDARIWGSNNYVERQFLIGKAMFIYWPHAKTWPLAIPYPSGGQWRWLGITPNFARMRLVR